MASSRLTGLERYWFDKGQLLATRYTYGEAMDLSKMAAHLAISIAEDAKTQSVGADLLRRIAARFTLDASGIVQATNEEPTISSLDRVVTSRRSKALHILASSFEQVAMKIEIDGIVLAQK